VSEARRLIARLRREGVQIDLIGTQLHVEAPAGVVTPVLRRKLAALKPEIGALLGKAAPPTPENGATLQHLADDFGEVAARGFAQHDVTPCPDDFEGAVHMEGHVAWWRDTLDSVYRGEMTLVCLRDGQISAHPRRLAS
jgi:hypothetical protein